jgi:UDP-glucose 4-epimerase
LPTQLPAGVDVRVCGDLAGPNPEVARDLEGVDLLLNLVAPSATASDAEHRRVHTEATRNLVGAARAAGVHWVGYLSSVKAIAGETAADLLTPSVPPRPTSAYGRAKLAAEKLVLESGIDATVVRCPMVFGPACGGNFSRLVRWLAGGGPVPAFGQPAARSVVSVQNLVAALIWLADHHPEVPRVVHVADPDPMSTDELMAMLAAALGRNPVRIPVPGAAVRALAALPLARAIAELLAMPLLLDTGPITGAGWRAPLSTREGIALALARR